MKVLFGVLRKDTGVYGTENVAALSEDPAAQALPILLGHERCPCGILDLPGARNSLSLSWEHS